MAAKHTLSEQKSAEFRDFEEGCLVSCEKSKCVFQQSEQKELLVVVVFGLWSEVNNLADDNLNGLRQSVS